MKLKRTLQILLLFCVVFLWMPMTAKAAQQNEAKIGDKEYSTLEEALTAAKSGDTVTLLNPITIADSSGRNFIINKNITIDGNGKQITKSGTGVDQANEKARKPIFTVRSGRHVVMQNIVMDNENNYNASIQVENGAEISVEDTTINFAAWGIENKGNLILKDGFELKQTHFGGDVESSSPHSAISNWGTCVMYASNISVEDSIGSPISCFVYNAEGGTFTMEGGYIHDIGCKSADSAIKTKGLDNYGKATINGGTFEMNEGVVVNYKECTINNIEINAKFNYVMDNYPGANLTINNANCEAIGVAILRNRGTAIINGGSYIHRERNGIENWPGNTSLIVTAGSISAKNNGIVNVSNMIMTGGTIKKSQTGIANSTGANFEMYGGEITENTVSGVENYTGATFKMYGGTISGNAKGVDNKGDFAYNSKATIENNGTPDTDNNIVNGDGVTPDDRLEPKDPPVIPTPDSSEGESVFEEEVIITDSEGNIVKEPERWVPTTPDEMKRYAFLGKEAVKYVFPTTNPYDLKVFNAMQGPKCFVSFEAALGDYTMGRTYNIYPDGKQAYSKEQKATITLSIPKDLQKEGRTYKMICVTEGGLPIVLNDLDKNSETITFETDKFYAFALIYK